MRSRLRIEEGFGGLHGTRPGNKPEWKGTTGLRVNSLPKRHQIPLLLLLLGISTGNSAALANEVMAGSCPLLVAPSNSEFQPKRIQPSQVAAKNAAGCLSPADAIYGPDGCPRKLCGANSGVIPLPGS